MSSGATALYGVFAMLLSSFELLASGLVGVIAGLGLVLIAVWAVERMR